MPIVPDPEHVRHGGCREMFRGRLAPSHAAGANVANVLEGFPEAHR